jgi:dTDP-4-dehydrorhamnose 3,5-epimerase
MTFTESKIEGAFIIEPELQNDERGFFAWSFCKEEFQRHGLDTDIVQCNISYNNKKKEHFGECIIKPFPMTR